MHNSNIGEAVILCISGRSRYNVLGALNFCGKKVTMVTNDTYISAEQVVAFMKKLLVEYKDKALALVLDNAAYQRCGKVTEYAREHGIGLIFLPPYSPNLNLIERFWKLVKSRVLNAAYHGTFDQREGLTKMSWKRRMNKHRRLIEKAASYRVPKQKEAENISKQMKE
jgi:transposase